MCSFFQKVQKISKQLRAINTEALGDDTTHNLATSIISCEFIEDYSATDTLVKPDDFEVSTM